MAIAYGYQLFARTPMTKVEVSVDGYPMSGIVPRGGWGGLRTSTRLIGDYQASWNMTRHPRKRLVRHPALHSGALVLVKYGPIVCFVGSLTEPNWDSGQLVARGAPWEGDGALALNAAGETTTAVDTAVDQGITRGALLWTRGHTFGGAIGAGPGDADIKSIMSLLDAWAEDEDNDNGWRITRTRFLKAVSNTETDPPWYITPGSGEMGAADDERADRVFVRFFDSTAAGAAATASYPASTPVGGIELGADITGRGQITPTKAGKIAEGIWRKMNGRSGWTNGLTVNRSQVTTKGGIAANLALIKAGEAMRLLGVSDPRGLNHHVDVVIGETEYDWSAGEIQLNPIGLAARTFDAVLEEVVPGATAL